VAEHKENIVVYCSRTEGFAKLLEYIREAHPQAHLSVIFPKEHVATEQEKALADEMIDSGMGSARLVQIPALRKLAQRLQAHKIDELIIQFESIKLRWLAVAVRPRRCTCWLGNGQLLELPTHAGATVSDLARHRLKGYGWVLRLFARSWLWPIRPQVPNHPDH